MTLVSPFGCYEFYEVLHYAEKMELGGQTPQHLFVAMQEQHMRSTAIQMKCSMHNVNSNNSAQKRILYLIFFVFFEVEVVSEV